jgi:chitin disaccharide deacetylase
MASDRAILFVADDYGIGPETSRGICELAKTGRLSATVLLANTEFAEGAVKAWQRAGRPLELGWHPNLTLDRPIADPDRVPSLVDRSGRFLSLNRFLVRASSGLIRADHVALELQAQYDQFCRLVGHVPRLVNSHQHVAAFGPVGSALLDILERQIPKPFVRRIGEPLTTLRQVPGARFKRFVLARRGRRLAAESRRRGFPGCDLLAGITDPHCVFDEQFFPRWFDSLPGDSVEFMCHPGHLDETLIERDCPPGDGVARRVREFQLMSRPDFGALLRFAGFRIASVDEFLPSALARAA